MSKTQSSYDILKIAALTATVLIVLALAFSALLPETFSRAQAAPNTVSEFAPDEQIYAVKKKRKAHKKKGRGFSDSSHAGGGGGGGSYHTNDDLGPGPVRQP